MPTSREFLFRGFQGCTNHGCVVTGPKKGMGTNGTCKCVVNASRSQLNLLQERLKAVLAGEEHPFSKCGWWLSGGWDDESWKSECGADWAFIDDGPEENGVRFCFSCGKPVAIIDPKE